ncbi:DUF7146 domain-containing protein [Chelatococcus asaccharovorans]|uniref:CHC2-type zinc finger protein n=1 Tax=Chelatococcus asaccharovorans TaxID=28210 RepID=A0A2V3UB06_9HYPH|nr:CHC2 zinc finger domain-containing protein [Chelatococcus asaccharovorans]MBS7703277.1 hypothetical protein [Chelatococcus asaccharovorans]PXW61609.1 CHC2-type zinc finger protein [Chelatococcus asaccharovorans]
MSTSARGRYDPDEIDDLKSRTPLSSIFARFGIRVRASGRAQMCSCPFHAERTPSCLVDDKRGTFKCFGCGAAGDHIDALVHLRGVSFREAVEELGGVRRLTPDQKRAVLERREEIEAEEQREREKSRALVVRQFDEGQQIGGTLVEAYLKARALFVSPTWTFDLRFHPALRYTGFADANTDEPTRLGEFPAMLAAIRDVRGDLIGVHRTYLDSSGQQKLTPPGDLRRNKAKKVLGEMRGGMIRLSPPSRHLAMGEGIETSRSWYDLGYGGDGISIASAVSLGNLSGGATGSIKHPSREKALIPNGEPDPDRPGVVLPIEIEEVTLIGDGDSDEAMTRARLLVAGRRFQDLGRQVFYCMAPGGKDFNDVLREQV